jgi:Flp pilus assembly protein TadD
VEDWANRNPDDWRSLRAAADVWFAEGQFDRAELWYEKTLARSPREPASLNNLAWILQERGDIRAVRLAETALKAAGDDPAILDTAGWVQFRLGDKQRALELLRKADSLAPGDPDIRYHLAAVLAETGDKAEARRLLEEALAGSARFPSRAEAERLLARL